jgi:hypothetical protein
VDEREHVLEKPMIGKERRSVDLRAIDVVDGADPDGSCQFVGADEVGRKVERFARGSGVRSEAKGSPDDYGDDGDGEEEKGEKEGGKDR